VLLPGVSLGVSDSQLLLGFGLLQHFLVFVNFHGRLFCTDQHWRFINNHWLWNSNRINIFIIALSLDNVQLLSFLVNGHGCPVLIFLIVPLVAGFVVILSFIHIIFLNCFVSSLNVNLVALVLKLFKALRLGHAAVH